MPVASDSTMPSIAWLAIGPPHSLTAVTRVMRSVAAVVDGKDSDNRMRVAVWFRGVSVMILIINTSGAAHLVVNRPRPPWTLGSARASLEEACRGDGVRVTRILGCVIPELLGLFEPDSIGQLVVVP